MPTWEYFELAEPRLDTARIYTEEERSELESLIAAQVASLLANHGWIRQKDLDYSTDITVEDITWYRILEVEEEYLDDDSEIRIGQIPRVRGQLITDPGVYHIQHSDEYDAPIRDFVVYDPTHLSPRPIRYTDGGTVELDLLQELHEFLGLLADWYIHGPDLPKDPAAKPELYPMVIEEAQFGTFRIGTDPENQ